MPCIEALEWIVRVEFLSKFGVFCPKISVRDTHIVAVEVDDDI